MDESAVFLCADAGIDKAFEYVDCHEGKHSRSPINTQGVRDCVAIVPASVLSWFKVSLPAKTLSRAYRSNRMDPRLSQIIGNILEDELLDDISKLHFALQPDAEEDKPIWVAVCDRQWLADALGAVREAGINITSVIPEVTPQGLQNTLIVHGDSENPEATRLSADGSSIVTTPLAVAVLDGSWADRAVTINAEPQCAAVAEKVFDRCDCIQTREQRALAGLATDWEMLQFELARPKGRISIQGLREFTKKLWVDPHWRLARRVTLALCIINIVGLNYWAMQDRDLLAQKEQRGVAMLKESFPAVSLVIDAPRQMERALKDLAISKGGLTDSDMESLMQAFGQAAGKATITEVEYSGRRLTLKATNVERPAAVIPELQKAGVQATSQNGTWILNTKDKQ